MVMGGIDVRSILRQVDDEMRDDARQAAAPDNGKAGPAPALETTRAEEIADNAAGDPSVEREIRNAARQDAPEKGEAAPGALDYEKSLDVPEYQRRAVAMMMNSVALKNAQKVIMVSNRANIQKGLSRDPGGLQKPIGKGQTSTVAIPTALLRYIQQEIGPLSGRTSQNDTVTGFLYWYFGQPDDVAFATDDQAAKVSEIADNLDVNASPSKFNRVNYNMSGTLLEKLDDLSERMDAVASLMGMVSKDGVELKVRSDKTYIALCYMILNFLGFAQPVAPGQHPEDLDLLSQGAAWELMSGVDTAYDYYRTKNGREIYKAKFRVAAQQRKFAYDVPAQPAADAGAAQDFPEDEGSRVSEYHGEDDEGYEDVYFDGLDDDYGDMEPEGGYVPEGDDEAFDPDAPVFDSVTQIKMRAAEQKRLAKLAESLD